MTSFRLRQLGVGARLGVACLLIVMLGGLAASVAHIYFHHSKRDEKAGLSVDDVKGAYGGVNVPSKLIAALEGNHPPELPKDKRDALLKWLRSDKVNTDYDNLDLGDNAPVEIISKNCLSCHARKVADTHPIAKTIPLDYFEDIKKLAYSKEINRVPLEILVVSSHTHMLTLAPLGLVGCGLLLATRWPRRFVGGCTAIVGVGLLGDMAGQWLARVDPNLIYLLFVGGGMYVGGLVLAIVATLAELVLPGRE
jgi:hypothetical protein